MFAVPKDTQLLIFTYPYEAVISQEGIKTLEAELTRKVGIPCIVLQKWFWSHDFEDVDFGVETVLFKEPKEPVCQPDPMLNKKPDDERGNRDDHLGHRSPGSPLRRAVLRFLHSPVFFALCLFLGLLCRCLIDMIFVD